MNEIILDEREREVEVTFKLKLFGRPHQIDKSMVSLRAIMELNGYTPLEFKHEVGR